LALEPLARRSQDHVAALGVPTGAPDLVLRDEFDLPRHALVVLVEHLIARFDVARGNERDLPNRFPLLLKLTEVQLFL